MTSAKQRQKNINNIAINTIHSWLPQMMTEGVSRRQYVTKLKYPTVISYANILPFLDAPILLFCLPFHHQKSIPI